MSLLDKATIITTPTAHSNGKLHSIKGGSVADFDVVRGSAATRVNAEGLIEDISIIGGELVTNGDFSNGSTGWTLQTGWSIADDKAVFSDTANGDIRTLNAVFTANSKYKINLTVSDLTSGSAVFAIGSGSSSNLVDYDTYINGNYSFEVTAPTGQELRIYATTSSSSSFSIDNVSIKEIIDATNIPRIDYTTGEGVILTEPQSTNLITYSEDFSNSGWSKSRSTFTGNSIQSPSGVNNMGYLTENTASSNTHYMRDFAALTDGADYTLSVFAKAKERSVICLGDNAAAQSNTGVWFDLTNGVVLTQRSGYVGTIKDFGNGIYRCSVTYAASAARQYTDIALSLSDGVNVYTGDGISGLYIWGAQVEEQSYATSYIPTSGAIATRLADAVTGAGDSSTFNSAEGVLYAETAINILQPNSYIQLSDGTYNNRVAFINNSSTNWRAFYRVGGVSQIDSSAIVLDAFEMNKLAISWKLNEFKFFVNGVKVAEVNSGVVNGANTFNQINFSDISNTNPLFGKTKTVAVFSEALTDEELTCLTTI